MKRMKRRADFLAAAAATKGAAATKVTAATKGAAGAEVTAGAKGTAGTKVTAEAAAGAKVAAGAKAAAPSFVLQLRERGDGGPARIGFTVSKKVGNAVERNRVRRRLREIVRLSPPERMRAGHDYVLIGRRAALRAPFERIAQDFEGALRRVHAGRKAVS